MMNHLLEENAWMESGNSAVNVHLLATRISGEIQGMLEYKSFYYDLQRAATSDTVKVSDFRNGVLEEMRKCSLDSQLKNMVYHWMKEKSSSTNQLKWFIPQPLDYIKKWRECWEKRVWKSLKSMCAHVNAPLARGRLNSEQDNVLENWTEFSAWDIDLSQFTPVYSPKDLLDSILQLQSSNYQINASERLWASLAYIPIQVKSLRELKSHFANLTTGEPHFGLLSHLDGDSDSVHMANAMPKLVQFQRTKVGEFVVQKDLAPVTQEYLKKGCPTALRAKLWQNILGSQVTRQHKEYYEQLKEAVIKCDLLIDRLILKDVQLTAANDDEYFVFEDSLYQVLLCFSRDLSLLDLFGRSWKNAHTAVIKSSSSMTTSNPTKGTSTTTTNNADTLSVIYPPNGIVPFHGFTMYVAPLCFLFNDPESLYFTFRSLYTRYWYKLHDINSDDSGILGLCILFEKLLHRHETQLWTHLRSLRVVPLRVVFKWLMKGFSGYLPAEQVLQLWDLMLAYNSLHIFPLFAMGVLSIRKDNLLKAHSATTVDAVLADLSSITVLPVLQLALSKDTF